MKKYFLLIFVLIAVFSLRITGVKADVVNISRDYIDDVWSFHYRNGEMWTFGNLPYNYADGKLVYCIEPDARINIDTYYTYEDFGVSGYDSYEQTQMELISYYGYGFPGHESIRYYMATQELIWLYSEDEWITWNTSPNEDGEVIDVSYEKNEIMNLVNAHYYRPSFSYQNFEADADYMYIRDWNNALGKYNINVPEELSYEVVDNQIKFTTTKLGTYTVSFTKKRNVEGQTLVFNNDSIRTQKLAIFSEPYIEEFSIDVTFKKAYVEILKKDIETNEFIVDKGINTTIKNMDTGEYINNRVFEFSNGKYWLYLPKGKYKVEELSASENYHINKDGIEFEISEGGDAQKEVVLFNEKVKGHINVNKVGEDDELLSGVEFTIYDEEGNIVDTLITDNGVSSSKDLPLGKYIVKETKELYGYEKNENIYEVEIKYKDDSNPIVEESLDIKNNKIKCEIVVITSGNEENLNASFNIYDTNYNLVYSGTTTDGTASFYLPYGEYILKEISVPDGYKLNEEEIRFKVNDITCNSSFSINNEKIIMPDTYSENSFIFIILFIINIGSYVYCKENS